MLAIPAVTSGDDAEDCLYTPTVWYSPEGEPFAFANMTASEIIEERIAWNNTATGQRPSPSRDWLGQAMRDFVSTTFERSSHRTPFDYRPKRSSGFVDDRGTLGMTDDELNRLFGLG